MNLAKARDERKKINEARLGDRLDAAKAAIVKGLLAAGVKTEDGSSHSTSRSILIKNVFSVSLEAITSGTRGYYHDGPNGDEPLSVKIGGYGGPKIRSAKEDPNLTGVRVPKIVAAIIAEIERLAREKAVRKTKFTNEESSFKLAERCRDLLPHGGPARFGATEARADMVVFSVRDMFVSEDEARELAAALTPILTKIHERRNPPEGD